MKWLRSSNSISVVAAVMLAAMACSSPAPADDPETAVKASGAAAIDAITAVREAVNAHWDAIRRVDTLEIANHHTADMTIFGPESSSLVSLGARGRSLLNILKYEDGGELPVTIR